MTLDEYCMIGMIPKELKMDMQMFIEQGHEPRVSVMRVLNYYTNTNEMVHRIQEYEKEGK